MQPQGDQNYWHSPDQAGTPTAPPPSQYVGEDLNQNTAPSVVPEEETYESQPIAWEASEYVHHEKNTSWFIILMVGTLILATFAFVVMKSLTFALLVCVMATAIAIFARRPPRILRYSLTAQGIDIDSKHYSYHDFRAFAVVRDGPLYSILLLPVKRFMPSVTIYFPEEHGEAIVDALGQILPMEQHDLDLMEQLARRLRF